MIDCIVKKKSNLPTIARMLALINEKDKELIHNVGLKINF